MHHSPTRFAVDEKQPPPAAGVELTTEYLMTMHAPGNPPQIVDGSLTIFSVGDGGWVKGRRSRERSFNLRATGCA